MKMDKISRTITVLENISKVCEEIANVSQTRLKTGVSSVFVQKVVASSRLSAIQVWKCMNELASSALEEVEVYKLELPFVKPKKSGNTLLFEIDDEQNAPEFTSIWMGDAYGAKKDKGLEALLTYLRDIYGTLNSDELLAKKVMECLKNETDLH